jgi:hypothetical protein
MAELVTVIVMAAVTSNSHEYGELIIDQLVGFLVMEPAHQVQVLDLALVFTFFLDLF